MIKYKLLCNDCELKFDSWFSTSSEYEKLKKKKLLICHNCNSEKVEKIASGKAKRNFSEDESGDMTAMRGAAGKAKGGPADYAKIDKFIDNSQGIVDFNNLIEFRKVGKLGEFK